MSIELFTFHLSRSAKLKTQFSWKINFKKGTKFEEQKFWHYHLQQSFFYKIVSGISFNSFRSGDKRLLSDFMRKRSWFHRYDIRFPKNLGSSLKLQNPETLVCGQKSNDYNDINIFLPLEISCTFLLAKEKTWRRIFKNNCGLPQNYTQNQFMPSKITVNWLFNDIWYCLVVGSFD